MGHKVHPTGIRLGIAKDWNSKWYANKGDYAKYLAADLKVREMLRKKLAQAGISKIQIERPAKTARVTIHTARPGVVIGKKGEDIEKLRKEVSDMMGVPAHINVNEVRKPELDAQLVAESIAQQLERRIMFRRAMKRAVGNAMRLGALGIKINVSGRLNGAELARSEWSREGRAPLGHVLQRFDRVAHALPAHDVGDEPAFLRRDVRVFELGGDLHVGYRSPAQAPASTFLSPECDLNVRVGANSPNL